MLVAIEECSEIQQALSKAMRFGLDDNHPESPNISNENQLIEEFYQLVAVFEELQKQKVITPITENEINFIKNQKIKNLKKYINYSQKKGFIV